MIGELVNFTLNTAHMDDTLHEKADHVAEALLRKNLTVQILFQGDIDRFAKYHMYDDINIILSQPDLFESTVTDRIDDALRTESDDPPQQYSAYMKYILKDWELNSSAKTYLFSKFTDNDSKVSMEDLLEVKNDSDSPNKDLVDKMIQWLS